MTLSRWERDDKLRRWLALASTILLFGLVGALIVATVVLGLVLGVESGYLSWLAYQIGRGSCQ